MHKPKTPEDLEKEIYSSVDKLHQIGDLRIRQLIKILSDVNDEIIIEGIIKVFENKNRIDTIYSDQKNAGLILQTLNPKTAISPTVIITRILKNWNKSVSEIPFWLKNNYSIETLEKVFLEIESKNLAQLELDKLKTLKWWLEIK
jgi:hypothetical protein